MIKLLVKLTVAALVANALYHIGSEYITFIRFRDAIRGAAIYRAKTDDDLRRRIVALAADYDVPIEDADITVGRKGTLVTVSAHYRKPIELAPQYPVSWPFDVSLEVEMTSQGLLPGAPIRP
jgi:hypothetical protein